MNDLKFAIRQLLKNPGFTAIAGLTLALGIMATTAMYSVVYAVLLDPFPYRDVDHLMSVKVWGAGERGYRTTYSTDQLLKIAERNTSFEGTMASTISDVSRTEAGDPQRLRGNCGTPNTFQVMGVPPLLGRGRRLCRPTVQLLLLTDLMACAWPARRAARIAPIEALRYE